MQRRLFLKSAGAVTVLVVGAGVWRACDQGVFSAGQGPAYKPWTRRAGARRNSSRKPAQYAAVALQSDGIFHRIIHRHHKKRGCA